MSFKDSVKADVDRVFLNGAEFAEEVNFNGQLIKSVVDDLDIAAPDAADNRQAVGYEGISLYVAEESVPDALVPGKQVLFNGEKWFVLGDTRSGCMRTIRLYREAS